MQVVVGHKELLLAVCAFYATLSVILMAGAIYCNNRRF